MSFWLDLKTRLAARVSSLSGVTVSPEDFVLPPRPELGDVSLGCFKLAKTMEKNPAEAAKALAAEFGEDPIVASVRAEGPFLNFAFQSDALVNGIADNVASAGPKFGSSSQGEGKTVVLEYAQPNTHKELHVGHSRNLTLGASLVRLLSLAGWKVIPASYHGDVGAHVAKCLWWMVVKSRGQGTSAMDLTAAEVKKLLADIPAEERTGKYLGDLYAAASRELDARPEVKDDISAVQRALETHEPTWEALWEETRQWSLKEMAAIFKELDVTIERRYLESEVVDEGQRIVDDLLKKGVAKESQGAIVVDLEDKKLGVFLIRKSDGTSLYATKDLALAFLKQKEYPGISRSIILVDNRQELYFKQLFETLRMMGYAAELEFAGYEFVTLKSGAMSSREGNVVTYQSFRDEVLEKTRAETTARHPEWDAKKIDVSAWALAMAGVKFGMLRQDSEKIFTFDLEQALSFEGDTGPYVQYATVRLGAILKKAKAAAAKADAQEATSHPAEKALALALARFEEVCARAARELRPSVVAQWCIETAQLANAFYRDVPVLDAPEPVRTARLALVKAGRDVLTQGLGILGIPVPDEM